MRALPSHCSQFGRLGWLAGCIPCLEKHILQLTTVMWPKRHTVQISAGVVDQVIHAARIHDVHKDLNHLHRILSKDGI